MRWLFLALPLALAACSSDPAPTVDSGPADTGTTDAGPLDVGSALCTPGMSTTCSCGALGTSTYVCPPSGLAPALCPCVDVDAALDVPAADLPEDRPAPVDVVDAGGADVGADVVAVADAVALEDVADVQLVDVAADRPDVVAVDVPRDAGPVDGGPVVYDLEAVRAGLEAHFAGRRTLPPPTSTSRDCPDDPSAASCSVAAGVVNFNLGACFGTSLTGRFVLGDAGPSTLSIFGGGGGSFATTLRFTTGPRVGGRRSVHVQFSAAPFQGEVGFSGIPGRTVDPALADLWLLGCTSD